MKQETYKKLGIALIIIAAFIRLAFALVHTVSGDACWHLASARFIAADYQLPLFEGLGRLEPFWAPPAFHFFAALLYKVFGFLSVNLADIGLKLASPVFATLTTIVLFLIARKLFDDRIGFYSMLFLNFAPIFIDYGIFGYVDSTAAFFSALAIYLMICRRYLLSSASFGIALLSKYNALFTLPMLVYLAYKQIPKKERGFTIGITILLPMLISSIWFLRNFILLGNPVWPFLNGFFNGVKIGVPFNSFSVQNIFSLNPYISTYLEFFGIPNGNLYLIKLFNIPYTNYLFVIWMVATIFFIFPFLKGVMVNNNKNGKNFTNAVYILFLSYLAMLFIYLFNTKIFGARLLLPIVPFMAIIWAKGIASMKRNQAYIALIILICAGFVITEAVKISFASREWKAYAQDFKWARDNSNSNDVFYGNGQCLSYNINRLVIDHTAPLDLNNVDYLWANEKWKIDFPMGRESMEKIRSSNKLKTVYSNAETGTTIYKVI